MKSIYLIVCLLVSGMFCWGATTDEFKFVSTLSSPVASFGTIETRSCLTTEPQGKFNIGTTASPSGTININGGPVAIETLYMEDGTNIKTSGNVKWLVSTLTVGKGSGTTVQVGQLIADSIVLNNNSNVDSTLDVTNGANSTLRIGSQVYTTGAEASSSLETHTCSDKGYRVSLTCFRFSDSIGIPTKDATWGTKIGVQTYTGGSGQEPSTSDVMDYYPIYTRL